MARHKAATEVTIAPLKEKSVVEELVGRYWMPAALATVLVAGWTLYRAYSQGQTQEALDSTWNELFDVEPSAAEFAALSSRFGTDAAAPWAKLMTIGSLLQDEQYAEASASIQELREGFPDHPLVVDALDFADGRPPRSLVDNLAESVDGRLNFEAEHPEVFENPPPPADAPRVRLQTERGEVLVALYQERAPEHAANFLTLCENGFYDNTRFHRVVPGQLIQGGDPNSRDEDRSTWGQGGSEQALEAETNDLHHFAGVLSAAPDADGSGSDGSQFVLTAGPAHLLDGSQVVFGTVLEGLDVVQAISEGALAEGSPDQPEEPVQLTSTTVP